MNSLRICLLYSLVLGSTLPVTTAQESAPITTLDPYLVRAGQVANEAPLPTYANPISLLNFNAQVDVQSRNFAEAQGDISIRGGTFENTGLNVGGVSIFDPQTGHYLTEQPIDPMMLDYPDVLTGYANFRHGFNATSGSIHYGWRAVSTANRQLTASYGENRLNTQSLYVSEPLLQGTTQSAWDVGIARSSSDGSIAGGDHQFSRYAARFQHRDAKSELQLFVGYQDKFFGWPNLYTPFNVDETESIQTLLILADYRIEIQPESILQLASYYRVNWDDYEFDRHRPGLFNPYEHKTRVAGFQSSWEQNTPSGLRWGISANAFVDSIDSTSLTHSFQSRTYTHFTAHASLPRWLHALSTNLSLAWFNTNRNRSALDGALRFEWEFSRPNASQSSRISAEYSGSSQVSGYTAIASAPNGLFAGNAALDTEHSDNVELAYEWTGEQRAVQIATFFRQDRDLTDWTYRFDSQNARTANAVDIDTYGFELRLHQQWQQSRLSLGYTYLRKSEAFDGALVDASFYALNFPRHRVILSLIHPLHRAVELRLDTEYRQQEANSLRRSGPNAWIGYASLRWQPIEHLDWDLRLSIDNLFDSGFEEVPAVPASPRQIALQSTVRW